MSPVPSRRTSPEIFEGGLDEPLNGDGDLPRCPPSSDDGPGFGGNTRVPLELSVGVVSPISSGQGH